MKFNSASISCKGRSRVINLTPGSLGINILLTIFHIRSGYCNVCERLIISNIIVKKA